MKINILRQTGYLYISPILFSCRQRPCF